MDERCQESQDWEDWENLVEGYEVQEQECADQQDWKGKDAVLLNDVASPSEDFYVDANITKLDDEEFETFWDELAHKNQAVFSADGQVLQTETPFGMRFLNPEVPYEEAKKNLEDLLKCRLMHRQVYCRTLSLCVDRLEFGQVESSVSEFSEFKSCSQSPYRFIKALEDAGGLRLLAIDAEGAVITQERAEGLTEDEVDDLVDWFALETTEAGREVAQAFSPRQLLDELIRNFPDRINVYRDLLTHLKAGPCKYADIEKLFQGRDFSMIKTLGAEKHVAVKPSVFVDNLEKAGGIVWRDRSWHVTKEGEALLEKMLAR